MLKAQILAALEKAGGEAYLLMVAKKHPKAFVTLLGRLLPAELTAKVDATVITVERSYGSTR